MGYSCGAKWTEEHSAELRELKLRGVPRAEILSSINAKFNLNLTYAALDSHMTRLGICRSASYLESESLIIPFSGEIHLPDGDYLITCDYHSPYYSTIWHNRSLAIADKLGLRKIIVIGDLVDFAFASFFYSEKKPTLDQEKDENARLLKSLIDTFDEIILLKGNHEDRLGRLTDGKVQAQVLLELWTREHWQKKVKYSIYDKLFIGDKWLCVHPKSYSQISGQVAKKLAAKFHRHVINAHGHFISYGYDVSGQYIAVDMGGIFDPEKIEYKTVKTTTHPEWNQGFGAISNGHFFMFDKMTDWDFWLK